MSSRLGKILTTDVSNSGWAFSHGCRLILQIQLIVPCANSESLNPKITTDENNSIQNTEKCKFPHEISLSIQHVFVDSKSQRVRMQCPEQSHIAAEISIFNSTEWHRCGPVWIGPLMDLVLLQSTLMSLSDDQPYAVCDKNICDNSSRSIRLNLSDITTTKKRIQQFLSYNEYTRGFATDQMSDDIIAISKTLSDTIYDLWKIFSDSKTDTSTSHGPSSKNNKKHHMCPDAEQVCGFLRDLGHRSQVLLWDDRCIQSSAGLTEVETALRASGGRALEQARAKRVRYNGTEGDPAIGPAADAEAPHKIRMDKNLSPEAVGTCPCPYWKRRKSESISGVNDEERGSVTAVAEALQRQGDGPKRSSVSERDLLALDVLDTLRALWSAGDSAATEPCVWSDTASTSVDCISDTTPVDCPFTHSPHHTVRPLQLLLVVANPTTGDAMSENSFTRCPEPDMNGEVQGKARGEGRAGRLEHLLEHLRQACRSEGFGSSARVCSSLEQAVLYSDSTSKMDQSSKTLSEVTIVLLLVPVEDTTDNYSSLVISASTSGKHRCTSNIRLSNSLLFERNTMVIGVEGTPSECSPTPPITITLLANAEMIIKSGCRVLFHNLSIERGVSVMAERKSRTSDRKVRVSLSQSAKSEPSPTVGALQMIIVEGRGSVCILLHSNLRLVSTLAAVITNTNNQSDRFCRSIINVSSNSSFFSYLCNFNVIHTSTSTNTSGTGFGRSHSNNYRPSTSSQTAQSRNTSHILYVSGKAHASLVNCELFGSDEALAVTAAATATLLHCDITDCLKSGVKVTCGAVVRLRCCQLHRHSRCGIESFSHGRIALRGCSILNNNAGGVLLSSSTGDISHCDISGSRLANVTASKASVVTMLSSVVRSGRASGVFVTGNHSAVTVTDCNIFSHGILDVEVVNSGLFFGNCK